MALYHFIGFESVLHHNGVDTPLTQFGQRVELTDAEAQLTLGNRIPLLSDAEWKGLGLTDSEVTAYQTKGISTGAFAAKRQKAVDLFVAKLAALFSPPVIEQKPVPAAPDIQNAAPAEESAQKEDKN